MVRYNVANALKRHYQLHEHWWRFKWRTMRLLNRVSSIWKCKTWSVPSQIQIKADISNVGRTCVCHAKYLIGDSQARYIGWLYISGWIRCNFQVIYVDEWPENNQTLSPSPLKLNVPETPMFISVALTGGAPPRVYWLVHRNPTPHSLSSLFYHQSPQSRFIPSSSSLCAFLYSCRFS